VLLHSVVCIRAGGDRLRLERLVFPYPGCAHFERQNAPQILIDIDAIDNC